ncbi:MAG TPA: flavin reductase family protein, partial [Pseudorhizobium sp.]|nr:flavin reductase family protein [Pseudorhizobium sp.]
FALNTLAADHQMLASEFAGLSGAAGADRFASGDWTTLSTGAPVLSDALAVFDCRVTDVKPVSTHFVLFGEVVGLQLGKPNPALIYLDRRFRTL